MSTINELFDVLVASSIKAVEPANLDPNRQYFVVLDGFDRNLDLDSKLLFFQKDLPERILEQMDVSILNDANGKTIDVCDPGLGRHLYRMSGEDARMLIINVLLFGYDVLDSIKPLDNTEMRRMTNEDIIANYSNGLDQALRLLGINVTLYDVSSMFKSITLGE